MLSVEPLFWVIAGMAAAIVAIVLLLVLISERRAREHLQNHLPFSVAIHLCSPMQPVIMPPSEAEKSTEEPK